MFYSILIYELELGPLFSYYKHRNLQILGGQELLSSSPSRFSLTFVTDYNNYLNKSFIVNSWLAYVFPLT